MTCYLDNSATTKPTQAVVDAMVCCMQEGYHNPSSLYAPALEVEKQITACRTLIAERLNAENVFFTSGGTEANNLAIFGALKGMRKKGKVLYSAGEHPSVLETCKQAQYLGFEPEEIPLSQNGVLQLGALRSQLKEDVSLICIMHVNNETGSIQPIHEVAKLRDSLQPDALLHVDGVQGFLRLPTDMRGWGVDSYALSGHKIHASKGVGALALGGRTRLTPLFFGGGQEAAIRSGTENTPGIAGLKKAIETYPAAHNMQNVKMKLFSMLQAGIENLAVNGPEPDAAEAAPHILNVSFPPVRAETMLHALEGDQIYVGNGSACSSKKKQISHVLAAMGSSVAQAESAIRFSLNPFLTEEDIQYAAKCCIQHYQVLKKFIRR